MFSKNDVINLLRGKRILNIFSFQGHRTLKPRSKFNSKNLFFVQFKTKWSIIGFNTPFRAKYIYINTDEKYIYKH